MSGTILFVEEPPNVPGVAVSNLEDALTALEIQRVAAVVAPDPYHPIFDFMIEAYPHVLRIAYFDDADVGSAALGAVADGRIDRFFRRPVSEDLLRSAIVRGRSETVRTADVMPLLAVNAI